MSLSESASSSAASSPQLFPSDHLYSPSFLSTSSSDTSPGEEQKLSQEDVGFSEYRHGEPYDTVKESKLVPSIEAILSKDLNALDSAAIPILLPSLEYPDILAGRPRIRDDILIMSEPSTQVDYLAHNWTEPDIWLSWRHIQSLRVPSNQKIDGYNTRLGNACWRSWAKLKNKLKTCSPEILNWEKDDDITWLYGPIQTKTAGPITSNLNLLASKLPKSRCGSKRASILKMRSLSEVMLRRSVNLMQQAITSLHAQELGQRLGHDLVPFRGMYSNYATSWGKEQIPVARVHASSSSENAIHNPQRHIRFDDKVGQCAISYRNREPEREACYKNAPGNRDPTDDKIMNIETEDRDQCILDGGNQMTREFADNSNQAIEALAPTTPSYEGGLAQRTPWERDRRDFWDLAAGYHTHQTPTAPKHLQISSDEDEEDIDMGWLPSTVSPPTVRQNRVTAYRYRTSDSGLDNDMDFVTTAARATLWKRQPTQPPSPPDMFAPHWDSQGEDVNGEDDKVAGGNGLYGRVLDAVNTARDIAIVVWHGGTS